MGPRQLSLWRLTLSGAPWRPAVSWMAGPGAGWSDVTDLETDSASEGDDEENGEEDGEGEAAGASSSEAPRLVPLGFGGRLEALSPG